MSVKIGRNDPCWCGSGKKYKKCHEAFDDRLEKYRREGYAVIDHDLIKTPDPYRPLWTMRASPKVSVPL